MPFYASLIQKLKDSGKIVKIFELSTSAASVVPIDVFKIEFNNKSIAVAFPGLGAPFVAAIFEELIALGSRKFVACGSAGVLKSDLKRGTIVIPSAAVRDEGTSFHYLPPARIVEMEPEVVLKLEAVLQKHHVNYEIGKSWSSDAFYRETKGKISRRKAEGCMTVEMECAAFLAVSKFRGVKFGQYLDVGDDVSGGQWDPRYVSNIISHQEKVFWLAVEAVLSL